MQWEKYIYFFVPEKKSFSLHGKHAILPYCCHLLECLEVDQKADNAIQFPVLSDRRKRSICFGWASERALLKGFTPSSRAKMICVRICRCTECMEASTVLK
jgi:hypothetical protein